MNTRRSNSRRKGRLSWSHSIRKAAIGDSSGPTPRCQGKAAAGWYSASAGSGGSANGRSPASSTLSSSKRRRCSSQRSSTRFCHWAAAAGSSTSPRAGGSSRVESAARSTPITRRGCSALISAVVGRGVPWGRGPPATSQSRSGGKVVARICSGVSSTARQPSESFCAASTTSVESTRG